MSQQLFTIFEDKIVINKLYLESLEGNVHHTGRLTTTGPLNVQNNLTVDGTIFAETLKVKTLIADKDSSEEAVNWFRNTEEELHGKGISWATGNSYTQLIYRKGNKLWTNADFDLEVNKSYKINNIEVINATQLGSQVTKSNLKEVGQLRHLTVLGDTILGEFAVFNSTFNRIGINTENPNSTLSIVENNVEIVIGSPRDGLAKIGTFTNSSLNIVTDDIERITVKSDGDIIIGNSASKNATVTIHGTLYVDNVISDNRLERTYPLEFKSTKDSSIYGQGLTWTGTGPVREFIMKSSPDRLWSSDAIDTQHEYYVQGFPVLSKTSLGDTVTDSSLTKLGKLLSLEVANELTVDGVLNSATIRTQNISSDTSVSISVNDETYFADENEIIIGNKLNTRRPVKIFGPLSIGINNFDPTVGLAVKGSVVIEDKKFLTGTAVPVSGTYHKGDICWNQEPQDGNYIGWVCVQDGTPGIWLPFGAINRQ